MKRQGILFRNYLVSFNKGNPSIINSNFFTMNAIFFSGQMNAVSNQSSDVREEVATWPSEPYILDRDNFNWN